MAEKSLEKTILPSQSSQTIKPYISTHKIRFITATSLFDGHDVSINMVRRLLQQNGVEVIHLGHNRSVLEVIKAAIQEDVQAIAISSYQGGHMEYFQYMYDLLNENNAKIKIIGGGGGVIIPEEIKKLHDYGITRIYSPDDGTSMGLQGMINDILKKTDFNPLTDFSIEQINPELDIQSLNDQYKIAKALTLIESGSNNEKQQLEDKLKNLSLTRKNLPVIGITGTGGAGKSSLTDELVLRFLNDFEDLTIAILSIDPSKKKTGGALLGDRIRMNSISDPRVFARSYATRGSKSEVSDAIPDAIELFKKFGFELIIVETSGIGQADSAIAEIADMSIYVMTPEYGAASQLEKIQMLDFANLVVLNKFDRLGAEDAFRDVKKQYRRNHNIPYKISDEELPIFGTIASNFNDTGINALYYCILNNFNKLGFKFQSKIPNPGNQQVSESIARIVPTSRVRYLSDITETIQKYKKMVQHQSNLVREISHLKTVQQLLFKESKKNNKEIEELINQRNTELNPETNEALKHWETINQVYKQDSFQYKVRDTTLNVNLFTNSLAGIQIPRISLPKLTESSEIVRFVLMENIPGYFPFTAGVFPFKRESEDPRRQFAGEGPPERTNKRFHYLTQNDPAKRLSTAFDSVTLYGEDPATQLDILGKIGESGVNIASLDDMKKLYKGFNLCDPNTSVSMTINGPAPIILAFFLNTAIDQQLDHFKREKNRNPNNDEYNIIRLKTFQNVRGTVQADILKEDQAQNTCIFSIYFAIKMMGDIQEFFIKNQIRNYYSVSVSGYHIAEAGANPISQLAFTLANGFTYVEYYLARGMNIDDFAPSLSFFFSNGLDPEYTVIGRVARRIWAIAMKNYYRGNKRSQRLKYHIQTSGRSLHAQEIDFNDIRTTLQALMAIYDNCNSLHTNSYDEAVTTPTEESVRRAMAIQLIITNELGWAKNENPFQGAYIIEELTDLVENAVLAEFDRITERGGVLGAMELGYQRSRIQEESLLYEQLKHNGELPIIGVNTFSSKKPKISKTTIELSRSTQEEKEYQIQQVQLFQEKNKSQTQSALTNLIQVAIEEGNIFEELMQTVRFASLGQITHALHNVGGKYRRGM